jgi:hypothetical protein
MTEPYENDIRIEGQYGADQYIDEYVQLDPSGGLEAVADGPDAYDNSQPQATESNQDYNQG